MQETNYLNEYSSKKKATINLMPHTQIVTVSMMMTAIITIWLIQPIGAYELSAQDGGGTTKEFSQLDGGGTTKE